MPVLNAPPGGTYMTIDRWQVWSEVQEQRTQGWKLHIAVANAGRAQAVLNDVCQHVLYPMQAAHKFWPSTDPIGNLDDNGGKWFAVFPGSVMTAFVLASAIEDQIERSGLAPPGPGAVPHEHRVDRGFVYTRYGAYSFRGVEVGGEWRADLRQELHPPGVENPWLRYPQVLPSDADLFPLHTAREVPRTFL